jgi:hypothetical protein
MPNHIVQSHLNHLKTARNPKRSGRLQPNKSLKLTEVAIDDFAARGFAGIDMISRYVRATDYMELAVRRRSLAPVR